MTRPPRRSFEQSLLTLAKAPSQQLILLEKLWPEQQRRIERKRREVAKKIDKGDPIKASIDLLTPLDLILDETVHTRALAFLLKGDNGHEFQNQVLSSIFKKVSDIHDESNARKILSIVNRKIKTISVTPEYRWPTTGFRNRSVARCDIRIEIKAKNGRALIIIENKIRAPEGKGQLGCYERYANVWRKNTGGYSMLIYLAPERGTKENWVSLSYLDLASALRAVWKDNAHAQGREWLALYIASITRGVLGIDVVKRPQDVELGDLNSYRGRI